MATVTVLPFPASSSRSIPSPIGERLTVVPLALRPGSPASGSSPAAPLQARVSRTPDDDILDLLSDAIDEHNPAEFMRVVRSNGVSPAQLRAIVNTVDAQGDTLLWKAIRSSSIGCFSELLKAGADPKKKDAQGKNALQMAMEKQPTVQRTILVDKLRPLVPPPPAPPPLSPAQIRTGLERAVTQNDAAMFGRMLADKGLSEAAIRVIVNTPDAEGKTLLMLCIELGSTNCLAPLLAAGADPTFTQRGANALHLAVGLGRPQMIAPLIEAVPQAQRAAFINARDDEGASPFLYAVILGKVQCLRPLVEGGADLICTGRDRAIYDHVLFLDGDSEVARELLQLEPRLKGIFGLKMVGHVFGFDPKPTSSDHDQALQGSAPRAMLKLISDDLQKPEAMKKLSPLCSDSQSEELTSAFAASAQADYSDEQIRNKVAAIKDGRLTVIDAGWNGHAVDIVFKDGYLVICNRGAGCTGPNGQKRTFFAAKIDLESVDETLIKAIIEHKSGNRAAGLQFLYGELPGRLHAQTDDDVCQALRDIAPTRQTGGTCGYASGLAALRASLALLTRDYQGAKEVSQQLALGHKERTLEMFRQTPSLYREEYRSQVIAEQTAHIAKQKAEMRANAGLVKLLLRLKENIDDSYEVGRILYSIELQYGIKKREALEARLAAACKHDGMDTSAPGFAKAMFVDPSCDRRLKLRAIRSVMDTVDPY